MKPRKMNMLGIQMDCISYDDMYMFVDNWLNDKNTHSHTMSLINVNCCVSSLRKPTIRDIFNSADIVGIDSMPFLKWARTFYNKKSDRFYAPDLLLEISSKSKEKEYTHFFYGGYPGAADRMEEYLNNLYDGIKVVGKYSPPFRELTDEEDHAIINMINSARPDFLWIGLGSPKQDIWIHERKEKIRGSIIIPSGATFDFFSGRINQAPKWIRNLGFEWLFRVTQDFPRLWKRYTIYNVIFICAFFLQLIGLLKFESKARDS